MKLWQKRNRTDKKLNIIPDVKKGEQKSASRRVLTHVRQQKKRSINRWDRIPRGN